MALDAGIPTRNPSKIEPVVANRVWRFFVGWVFAFAGWSQVLWNDICILRVHLANAWLACRECAARTWWILLPLLEDVSDNISKFYTSHLVPFWENLLLPLFKDVSDKGSKFYGSHLAPVCAFLSHKLKGSEFYHSHLVFFCASLQSNSAVYPPVISSHDDHRGSIAPSKRSRFVPRGKVARIVAACSGGLLLRGMTSQSKQLESFRSTANLVQPRTLLMESEPTNATYDYDAFNTPSVQCRLEIEKWQNENIDWWMKSAPFPMVEWVWELPLDDTSDLTIYKVLLNALKCGKEPSAWIKNISHDFFDWQWQDQRGDTHKVDAEHIEVRNRDYMPRVFFRLTPIEGTTNEKRVPKKLWPTWKNGTTTSVEYDLEPYVHCNKVEQENPPPPDVKIGACITRFWGQHDLMPEWIAYHRMLGIQHFWFFVNEPFENIYNTMPRYEKDITYIPYNFTWEGHKHNGNNDTIADPSGWHANGENWFQYEANNQCLYMAKQYGLDWIITPDVDEYVVISDPTITHFDSPTPLQQYFHKYHNTESRSSLSITEIHEPAKPAKQICVIGGGFGRHPTQEDNNKTFELSIDFTYRKDKKYGSGDGTVDGKSAGGRRKCFFNVSAVSSVEVHSMTAKNLASLIGGNADMRKMELYHFRTPLLGPQQSTPDQLVSYPELRDKYRDKVMAELRRLKWPLPKFSNHVCNGYTSNC